MTRHDEILAFSNSFKGKPNGNEIIAQDLKYMFQNQPIPKDFYAIKFSSNDSELYVPNNCSKSSINFDIFGLFYELELIPKGLLDLVLSDGYAIYVVNDKIYGTNDEISGVCVDDFKHIIVNNERIENALIHEISHAIDFILGITNLLEFIEIYKKEKAEFIKILKPSIYEEAGSISKLRIQRGMLLASQYYTKNAQEFFAEASSQYFKNNEQLKTFLPQTWEFLNKIYQPYSLIEDKQPKTLSFPKKI